MSTCYHCKQAIGFNEEYYLIRSKDTRFRGRKRHQTVAYCCVTCEEDGKPTRYSLEEWQALRDQQTKQGGQDE